MPLQVSNFFNNSEGLNTNDSPFFVTDNQATGGYSYDYVKTGAIQKIRSLLKTNPIADAQARIHGMGLYNTAASVKTVIRTAGSKVQTAAADLASFTNIASDSASPTTDFFTPSSTQPVISNMFNTGTASVIWMQGAGTTLPIGYTGSKVTINGSNSPTGTFTAVNQGSATGGNWGAATGIYYYSIALRKTSTQALSNADLDQAVTIVTATDSVLLTFPTGVDATLYDKWYVYRSAVGGTTDFTAGTLIAQVTVGTLTYTDTNNAVVATSQLVPREGFALLDNTVLPANTYNYGTIFKRRYIVATGSTVHIGDLDKPESWPTGLRVTIPTGGAITGFAISGFNSPIGNTDEYLMIFKDRECWLITGSFVYDGDTGLYDYELKFLDNVGCPIQTLATRCGGWVCWLDVSGVYIWNGQGKPFKSSRLIQDFFDQDGMLDKTQIRLGWGVYFRKKNQVIWTISHRTYGANKIRVKLDLRLTIPRINTSMIDNNEVDGVFMMDNYTQDTYAGLVYLPDSNDETMLTGDNAGFVYKDYFNSSEDNDGIQFSYRTKALNMDKPTEAKSFNKVIVYVDQAGDYDLKLKYWAGYKGLEPERSEINQNMQDPSQIKASLWDLAIWDRNLWDENNIKTIALIYNLSSAQNNNTGDSLILEFSQMDPNAPVTIHGFSVVWDHIALRK